MPTKKQKSTVEIEAVPFAGMESFVAPVQPTEERDEFTEGKPRFFDASRLPDAPGFQPAADNSACIMYVLFPNKESMLKGLIALTRGKRKYMRPETTIITIDSNHPGREETTQLERWWAEYEEWCRLKGVDPVVPVLGKQEDSE